MVKAGHEKNKPKGNPFQTRARVLVETMKGPTSRVRLKERMIGLSTKDVDYHIMRAENSLLKLKVIRERNNRITYIVSGLETLVNMAEILAAHKEKGATVRDSIDSAYAKCFMSSFGSGPVTFPSGAMPEFQEVSDAVNKSKGMLQKELIESVLKFSEYEMGPMDIKGKFAYIVTVLANVNRIKNCYLGGRNNVRASSVSGKTGSVCELWAFTHKYTRPFNVVKWGTEFSWVYPEIPQLLYYRVLREPIFYGKSSFEVIDDKLIVNNEENRLIATVGMLISQTGRDSNRDLYWDPFSDGTIREIIDGYNLVIKTSKSKSELNTRILKPFYIEYLNRKAALLKKEMIRNEISPTEIPGLNFFEPKHFK